MAGVLWQLIWINLISLDPLTIPLRLPITAGAAAVLPWGVVVVVAAVASSIGILPVYFLVRWKIAHPWERQVAQHARIAKLRARWRGRTFLWQVVLNSIPFIDWFGVGIAGCERYPFGRFFASLVIGRCIHNTPIVLGGLWFKQYAWFQWWVGFSQLPVVSGSVSVIVLLIIFVAFVAIRRTASAQATP